VDREAYFPPAFERERNIRRDVIAGAIHGTDPEYASPSCGVSK
jgi:hypothetical protein